MPDENRDGSAGVEAAGAAERLVPLCYFGGGDEVRTERGLGWAVASCVCAGVALASEVVAMMMRDDAIGGGAELRPGMLWELGFCVGPVANVAGGVLAIVALAGRRSWVVLGVVGLLLNLVGVAVGACGWAWANN